jgi:hypothetical protein
MPVGDQLQITGLNEFHPASILLDDITGITAPRIRVQMPMVGDSSNLPASSPGLVISGGNLI